jgi:hypothetical protein
VLDAGADLAVGAVVLVFPDRQVLTGASSVRHDRAGAQWAKAVAKITDEVDVLLAFYASAERVFDPPLQSRPVVVLSDNDGCVVAADSPRQGPGPGDHGRAGLRVDRCRLRFRDALVSPHRGEQVSEEGADPAAGVRGGGGVDLGG